MEVRNPKWTSYGALELDIFSPTKEDSAVLQAVIAPLVRIEFWRNLDEPQTFKSPADTVEEARSFFNAERFWESHETLEALWRTKRGAEKELLQGLILVAAAFVHAQKDELDVSLGIFRRALPKLSWREGVYYGVDVGAVRDSVSAILAARRLEAFRI